MSNMNSSDTQWEHMLSKAIAYQQDFYELLPDWTVYKKSNIQYLKQNIGYAIFGPPLFEKSKNSNDILNFKTHDIADDKEIFDLVEYSPSAKTVIDLIVDQIYKHGGQNRDNTIKCGIIYNILFRNKTLARHNTTINDELIAMPIFKILKYNDKDNVMTNKHKKDAYTTWYIDVKARVYKSWKDYITANNLPKCTMVFPKDGYYQPNPNHVCTPNQSIVWVIAQDSYACSQRAEICSIINATVTVSAGASLGLGITSLLTPVGPVIATAGLATASISSLWTIGKCSAELYDRSIHEESISPLNSSNLSAWLGIAGCTIGIVANGGTILLKKAAMAGTEVGMISRAAYNATLIGSISINLIGLGYQGFRIYEKFQEDRNIDIQDIVYFGTHLLFFMNSVVDFKFAGDIISLTQGEILKDFETNLRDDNLRKHYNYIKDKAVTDYAGNNTAQNAAVIRYIKKVTINNVSDTSLLDNSFSNATNTLAFENGKLKINGITLLDPMVFVADIARGCLSQAKKVFKKQSNSNSANQNCQLVQLLETLLSDLYTSGDCPSNRQLLTVPDFKSLIKDLKKVQNSENILPFIFNTAVILLRSLKKLEYLVEGCRFVWEYVKTNMRNAGLEICAHIENDYTYNNSIKHLRHIFMAIYDAIDSSIHRFLNALHQYMRLIRKQVTS